MLTTEDVKRNASAALGGLDHNESISLLAYIAVNHPDVMAAAARGQHAERARAEEIREAAAARVPQPLLVPPNAAGKALSISGTWMVSTLTRHVAMRLCEPGAECPDDGRCWSVTWLPGQALTQPQAVTAMMIATHIHSPAAAFRDRTPAWNRTAVGHQWWGRLDSWAAELDLSGAHALTLASMSPEAHGVTVSA